MTDDLESRTLRRSRPVPETEDRMTYHFRLQRTDGSPADPPTFQTTVPNWQAGDVIPLGGRSLRLDEVRDDDADQAPTLVVEDVP